MMTHHVYAPRWLKILVRALGWMGALWVAISHAAGTTIPERVDDLCHRLGYGTECTPIFEAGLRGRATLIVTVNDSVSEPNMWPATAGVTVSTVTLIVRRPRAVLSKSYQVNATSEGADVLAYLREPPCITLECVERRVWVPGYTGTRETDFTDAAKIVNKVFYQVADTDIADALQKLYGASGVPVITRVLDRSLSVADESGTRLSTGIVVDVDIQFALPVPRVD